MIDFSKQPHCETCPHCIGWAYPRGQQRCAADLAYKEDGSCTFLAERIAQLKLDAASDSYDTDDDYNTDEEE